MNLEEIKERAKPCAQLGTDWYEVKRYDFDWLISEVERLRDALEDIAETPNEFSFFARQVLKGGE